MKVSFNGTEANAALFRGRTVYWLPVLRMSPTGTAEGRYQCLRGAAWLKGMKMYRTTTKKKNTPARFYACTNAPTTFRSTRSEDSSTPIEYEGN